MEEEFVVCPFNKEHKMLRKRLLPHIIKCRLLYPDVELLKCPFNQSHLLPQTEYVQHVTNCEDRKVITQYKFDILPLKEEEVVQHAPIECDDNWDDDVVEDFDPQINIQNAKVLRKPNGLLRAERRTFLAEECKRLPERDEDYEQYEYCKTIKTIDYSDNENDENKVKDASYLRPITPPPPTGIDWSEKASSSKVKRERSRSPLSPRYKTIKSEDNKDDIYIRR